jgi:hypothetical protein
VSDIISLIDVRGSILLYLVHIVKLTVKSMIQTMKPSSSPTTMEGKRCFLRYNWNDHGLSHKSNAPSLLHLAPDKRSQHLQDNVNQHCVGGDSFPPFRGVHLINHAVFYPSLGSVELSLGIPFLAFWWSVYSALSDGICLYPTSKLDIGCLCRFLVR